MIHRQQQQLPTLMSGSAESTPMTTPPMTAGWRRDCMAGSLAESTNDERRTASEELPGYRDCCSRFIRHSSFVIRHSSFVIRRSSFDIRQS
jgi:hypothetical protein